MLSDEGNEKVHNVVSLDVTPLSLGMECIGDVMNVILPSNTTIPTRRDKIVKTSKDNQTIVMFAVYKGDRTRSTDNNLLGEFELYGIPAAPRGVAKFKVCIDIDENGIMNVSAEHMGTKLNNKITINNYMGRLSDKEIEKMVKDVKTHGNEDMEFRKKVDASNVLEDYAYNMRNTIRCAAGIRAADKNEIDKAFEYMVGVEQTR